MESLLTHSRGVAVKCNLVEGRADNLSAKPSKLQALMETLVAKRVLDLIFVRKKRPFQMQIVSQRLSHLP